MIPKFGTIESKKFIILGEDAAKSKNIIFKHSVLDE